MTLVTGQSLTEPPRMIAAIILGRGALRSPHAFSVGIVLAAFIVHFALAIVLALILSLIAVSFSLDSSVGMATLVGAVFGVIVYIINFYGMTQFFPWFAEARNWVNALVHIVFGIVAADMYMKLDRRASNVAKVDSDGSS